MIDLDTLSKVPLFNNITIEALTYLQPCFKQMLVPKGTVIIKENTCLLYTSPSPRDRTRARMPSSA